MIDLSNVIALALGSDDVLQIQDAIGTVLWQKIIYYNVNISAGSNGTVSVNGVSGDYSQSVPSGTVLTIEGTGNTGYDFEEWSDGNITNPRTITVTGDLTLTASFESAAPLPNYFYVEDVSGSDNTLSITKSDTNAPTIEVFKSTDRTNWTSMGTTDTTAITATVPANGKLYLKANADSWSNSSSVRQVNTITASGNHNVGGNIMSLIYGDDFLRYDTFPTNTMYNFSNLFNRNDKLIDASGLIINYNCIQGCYLEMFYYCTSLTTAPALPATTLADSCYNGMFYNCSSLTTAPALPATVLANSCYLAMFQDCTALTTAPALPATTLYNNCYSSMFRNCSSLTTAPALPATVLANRCYYNMFKNCTGLTTAPALPATTLVYGCYEEMFNGCTNLNSVTTYADDISASGCLNNWLDSVSATGDFWNLGTAIYPSGASGIPSGWTEHNSL